MSEAGGDLLGLVLVDDQPVEQWQDIGRNRCRRRCVERMRVPFSLARRMSDQFSGSGTSICSTRSVFGPSKRIGKLRGLGLAVGAGRHHDVVFAELVDADGGKASRIGDGRERREIDTGRPQIGERRFRQRIAADAADHLDLGAGTRGGQGLVAALAARRQLIARPQHGFAGQRQMVDRDHHIDIERAENNDHAMHLDHTAAGARMPPADR